MNHKRRTVIASSEISELKTYSLGGYDQKVLIEGKYKTNPIVIFLHGGPGSPIPFCEGCRGMFPEITDRFLMVYWDQLGCGINNCKIDDSFSIDCYVNMTVELIQRIKKEFPENTISLFGVSWGSILAAKSAQRVPELLYRVMTYGQVLKQLSFNDDVLKTLENSNMPAKQRLQLESMKKADKHTLQELKSIMGWIRKYTEGYQAKAGGRTPLGGIICGILTSPDYSFKDFKAIVINGCTKNKSLLTELMDIDLSDVLRKIQVPYLILQGDTDIVTSTKMISAFTESASNENIVFHRIQNSGHMPSNAGMDYIIKDGFDFLDSRIKE
jgi:pimeloyl-ACP methyl ester carboxylesterase